MPSRHLRGKPRQISSALGCINSINLPFVGRTYYVDATNGNDNNDGIGNPWQTIAKVNAYTFQPMDRILFKRGETFTGALVAPRSYLTFADYGDGNLPVIDGNGTAGAFYALYPNNHLTLTNLDFYRGGYACRLYTNYVTVTNCIGRNALTTSGFDSWQNGTTFFNDNISLVNCIAHSNNNHGIFMGNNLTGVVSYPVGLLIDRCTTYSNGVSASADHGIYLNKFKNAIVKKCTSYSNASNGIKNNGGDNNLIERNLCYSNTLAGIYISGVSADPCNADIVLNNDCYSNNTGIYVEDYTTSNKVWHNTCALNGDNTNGAGILLPYTNCSGNDFKNNILYNDVAKPSTNGYTMRFVNATVRDAQTYDGNLHFWLGKAGNVLIYDGVATRTWAQWQALDAGKDPNGVSADPVFVTNYTDRHLQSTSPARNAGVDIDVTDDHDSNVRPMGATVDIGCYEYIE